MIDSYFDYYAARHFAIISRTLFRRRCTMLPRRRFRFFAFRYDAFDAAPYAIAFFDAAAVFAVIDSFTLFADVFFSLFFFFFMPLFSFSSPPLLLPEMNE